MAQFNGHPADLAARTEAIVSLDEIAFVPETLMPELIANRSPLVDLVDASELVVDIDYEEQDGSERTVAVYVIPLEVKRRPDGSVFAPIVSSPGSSAIPHGMRVLRVEARRTPEEPPT